MTKNTISLAEAVGLSSELLDLLGPFCERIQVAGSIRRQKQQVGDIELLAVPRIVGIDPDLFGDATQHENLLDRYVDAHLVDGSGPFEHRLDKNGRPAFGVRYKRLLYKGVPLDLFSVLPPAQWGVLFSIRTGPAALSHRLVTTVGMYTADGLPGLLPFGLRVREGQLLRWDRGAWITVETLEEPDFWDAIGVPWVPPHERTAELARGDAHAQV